MKNRQDRFVEVAKYIESHLDDDLDVEALCQLAAISKYHFHRQCSAFFGVPVITFVKMLRLKRAAYQLAYRDSKKIIDIALGNGYDSHEAFSRSFKNVFQQTPTQFRCLPDWTAWNIQYEPILELRAKIMDVKANFKVEIIDFPKILIATMEHIGVPRLLGQTIKKFITWRKDNGLSPNKSRTFNLVYDDPSIIAEQDYRFDLACEVKQAVDEKSGDIINKVIPAGQCARIRYTGSDDAIGLAVDYLYSNWLADSDYDVRDFPVYFERIRFFPEVSEHDMVTDIYLPIVLESVDKIGLP
ncbi:AraC family transcriptional regulator [Pseudomonas sp. HK3]